MSGDEVKKNTSEEPKSMDTATVAIYGSQAREYQHLPSRRVPMALADLHWSLGVGAPVALRVHHREAGHRDGGDLPAHYFGDRPEERLADLLIGAGFAEVEITTADSALAANASRARSLPDTVGPDMRLLVCGLNPSLYAADAGVGFARPSNRFWAAARAAEVVDQERDPVAALREHALGMTDLVKRATARSAEVTRAEYEAGVERVRRLVEWLEPAAVCFVGLEGYRTAVDRGATSGWQPAPFGGRPLYLMPSTSGLNASSRPGDFTAHLAATLHPPNLRQ